MRKYRFDENNSGGNWWLTLQQYEALRAAGWNEPESDSLSELERKPQQEGVTYNFSLNSGDVPYFWRHGFALEVESMRAAVESFEKATGENFFVQGCNCCGAPYSISTNTDDGGEYESMSGDSVDQTPIRPW